MIEIICQRCGAAKLVRPHKVKDGKGKFCSLECYNIHKKSPEHKAKIVNWFNAGAAARRGKPLTEDQRRKVSMGLVSAYQEGRFFGFQGHHHTDEERNRRRNAHLGKPKLYNRGERSHLWRGGVTHENHSIRCSLEYRNWRRTVFERDKFTCQQCFKRGGDIQAHHVKSFSEYPDLRFDVRNGVTLCEKCHKNTPSYMNRWQSKPQ